MPKVWLAFLLGQSVHVCHFTLEPSQDNDQR